MMSKVDVLRNNYELLKNVYDRRKVGNKDYDPFLLSSIGQNIIIPMLDISFDEGCEMWEYLLKRYRNEMLADPVDYSKLTDDMVENLNFEMAIKVFTRKEIIAKHVFELDRYENHLHCELFIRDLIIAKQFDLANKLIILLLKNRNGDNDPQINLYDTLHYAITSSESRWKMDSEGIDLICNYIKKVNSAIKRAQLEVELLSLIDCVEGDAARGPMPFSMINEDNCLEKLAEDKKRQEKSPLSSEPEPKSEFDKVMRERKERSKALKSENLEGQPKNVNEKELDEAIAELDALVGLSAVKDEVKSLCNLIKVRQIRLERGLRVPELSQHLVFSGKPGTGKTTVARIIGRIYHSLGFLSKGQFVEADRSKLVAGYVGQTALKTQDVITQALGGVLFIDEAYSLSPKYKEDFGAEAIETILKAMEDHRDDFVVIVAGYDELMEEFIASNPGLQSRFKKYIHFQDYKGDELLDIFLGLLEKNNYGIDINVLPFLSSYFEKLYLNRTNTFGNARDVRNLFEKVIEKQANRIVQINAPSDEDLLKIKLEDFGGLIK